MPQKEQRVADAYNDAAEYFAQNRLFLPERTAEKADSMLDTLHTALIEFDTAQMGNKHQCGPDQSGLWIQSYKRVREEIPPILKELEHEFREILGVEEQIT